MLFPIYATLFAAAVSAAVIPKTHTSSTKPSVTATAYTRAPTAIQALSNPSFEISTANEAGYTTPMTPWGTANTDANDYDQSGLVSNSDAPFSTPYGSEY